MDELRLLRPAEACTLLNVSRAWLYGAAKDGRIPCVRIGGPTGPLRFLEADLREHIEKARREWTPGDSSAAALRRASQV